MSQAYEAMYRSTWHHPVALVTLGLLALLLIAVRVRRGDVSPRSPIFAWAVAFGVLIVTDALLTADPSPLAPWPWLAQAVAIGFVWLGDVRAYVLVAGYGDPSQGPAKRLALGVVLGSLVTLAMVPATTLAPALRDSPRHIFLVYELLSLGLALLYFVVGLGRAPGPGPEPIGSDKLRFRRRVLGFVVVQYALWALSDCVILWIHPIGYLFRLIPNLLYYGCFVAYVVALAPASLARDPLARDPLAPSPARRNAALV